MTTTTTTTVSAPGKILLAGGYLVLESPNPGLVIAVDKRFYTTAQITWADTSSANNDNENNEIAIVVTSPQFQQDWTYVYDVATEQLACADDAKKKNPFVEKTLRVSLRYLLHQRLTKEGKNDDSNKTMQKIVLVLLADNDFYSLVPHLQAAGSKDRSWASAAALPPRLRAAKSDDGTLYKTGLGSSACLVTSLVGALYYGMLSSESTTENDKQKDDDDKTTFVPPDVVSHLAQLCHCHAQGKVGSGFDVSAALYGSHVYQRFDKSLLAQVLQDLDQGTATTDQLVAIVDQEWSGGVQAPLHLSGGGGLLQVMLADVSGGSESPSMARTVLAWKAAQKDAKIPHWDDLVRLNATTCQLLQTLATLDVGVAEKQALASSPASAWPTLASSPAAQLLVQLQTTLQESRHHLKALGEAAGVPIEPDVQTHLAAATTQDMAGVVAALVPGAGGYDALACLYVDTPAVQEAICHVWANYADAQVCPLTIQGVDYGQGLRLELTPPVHHC